MLGNERNGTLRVIVVLDIAEGTRTPLHRLDVGQSTRFLSNLRLARAPNPGCGFAGYPGSLHHAPEIRQISLEQRLRIAVTDLSSFNRLLDAMQEVATGALRMGQMFESFHFGG